MRRRLATLTVLLCALTLSVELLVTADAAGEIHVHSDPALELEYHKGETRLKIGATDQPGTVDVESHTLDKVIVQLEVS